MSQTSLMHYQDQYQKALPRRDIWVWTITGAKAVSLIVPQSATLAFFDTITQATINSFFGSTNEILEDKYDSTAMGTDAFGVLLNYVGQVQTLVSAKLTTMQGTGNVTEVVHTVTDTGLTASSLTNQGVLTANGNIGLRFVSGSIDGFTTGLVMLEVNWVSK